ncbi:hypothetical protein F9B85_06100 [Heliorestis acidaminivorans]|uniref:YbbR-like domain-containing protein n=1 Tax=Heliorestis acidaminivorans TaxID=553427 RepID=A0A6I0F7U9_9FIRM|nr:CdaR family protein [Heliorestis acidaminivorans]KAB2953473.1 hypothetical protein F9B85_06100 [Heliorestis acidaminivorans]
MDIAAEARKNWLYKIAAISLAILLWIYVQAEHQGTQVLTIPLEVEGLPSGLVVEPELPKVIELRVRGPRANLQNISTKDFTARVAMEDAEPGNFQREIQIESPPQIQVISYTPSQLNLNIDVLENRSLPIQYDFQGTMPAGYLMRDPVLQPAEVMISGPRERVRAIQRARVQIPLGARETFTQRLPVQLIDSGAVGAREGDIRISPQVIEVTVPIVEEMASKGVPIEPQLTGTPARGVRVTGTKVEPENVIITTGSERIKEIESLRTAPIDINEIRGEVTREVNLIIPSAVQTQGGLTRVRVTVLVEGQPEETRPAPPAGTPSTPATPQQPEPATPPEENKDETTDVYDEEF